jgi:lipid-A-disaccharide synthase
MSPKDGSQGSASVFIVAGEQSGDAHGSGLIKEIKEQSPAVKINFYGLGGSLMKKAGQMQLYGIEDLAAVGLSEVLKKYSFFKKVINECAEFIRTNNPDVVILIDYPGFNIRLAQKIRKFYGKKILYYISPQLWAWHESRVQKIRKYVDKMLVVFPFEVEFYKKHGIDAVFVGHPLTQKIKEFLAGNPRNTKPGGNNKTVTFLPGSRKEEIRNHMPVLAAVLEKLSGKYNITANLCVAPGMDKVYDKLSGITSQFNLTHDNIYSLILNSDLVLTKAGTSTMECALLGTPHLIFYKTSMMNYHLLKPFVKVNNLGIINILAGKTVVKEFIQNDFTADNLFEESDKILSSKHYSEKISRELEVVWEILGDKNASNNAAKIVKETTGI